jgi:hypothetical protein
VEWALLTELHRRAGLRTARQGAHQGDWFHFGSPARLFEPRLSDHQTIQYVPPPSLKERGTPEEQVEQ